MQPIMICCATASTESTVTVELHDMSPSFPSIAIFRLPSPASVTPSEKRPFEVSSFWVHEISYS